MDISATVLTGECLVEGGIGRISRDDDGCGFMDGFDQFEGEVRYTFAAGGRSDDEELEVRVIAFGGYTITTIDVGQDA